MRILGFKLLMLSVFLAHGQGYTPVLPKIIPPQPEAAAYMRYGEIPVDYSTGIPDISIPIYTVHSRKLELPITISYHASGIKVNDLATPVGLGWVINTGGIITRTVLDKRDEVSTKANFKTTAEMETARDGWFNQPFSQSTLSALGSLLENDNGSNSFDKQSDRFYYQLPNGKSGAFRYDFLTNSLIKIPFSPIQITKIQQTEWPYRIEGFTVVDADGTLYYYHVREYFDLPNHEHPDSWYLSSIVSADKTDTLRFTYKNFRNEYTHAIYSETLSWTIAIGGCGPNPINGTNPDPNVTPSMKATFEPSGGIPLVDKIISATSIVSFEYAADRIDGPSYRFSTITVTDRWSGALKKKIDLKHSNFGTVANNNHRLRLDSVIINSGQKNAERYSFRYNQLDLPAYANKTSPIVHYEDFWGYNNYQGNTELAMVPYQFLRPEEWSGYRGNRDPELTDYYAKACMLEEIRYPTGGKTVFEFERARAPYIYSYLSDEIAVGGFRVKSISNYVEGSKLAFKKTYQYGRPKISSFFTSPEQYKWTSTSIEQAEPCGAFGGAFISGGLQITTRTSAFSSPMHDLGAVMYDSVTEYIGDELNNNGKTAYVYTVPLLEIYNEGHPVEFEHPMFVHPYHWDRGTRIPRLSYKIEYRKVGTSYHKVRSTSNLYSSFHSENSYHTGVHVVKPWEYINGFAPDLYTNCPYFVYQDCNNYMNLYHYLKSFKYFDTKAYDEIFLLTQSDVTEFDETETPTLVNSVVYNYSITNHLLLTSEVTTNGRGETITTEFKYPQDFGASDPYDKMVARNIISPLVEQNQLKNGNLVQSIKTNFLTWNGENIIQPGTIEVKNGSNASETKVRFKGYDAHGNVTSVSKENDFNLVYLYGYSKSRPIAEVKNVSAPSQIAYTSFEDNESGNWIITGSRITDNTSPTGRYCLQLGSLQKSGLTASTEYILSYWYKTGATVTVTGAAPSDIISTPGKDGWTLITTKVTGTTTITISGSGKIDEVRLHPTSARMTTYTYDPLVGVTSECNVNNVIHYYEYDGSNRLQAIRDDKGNIIKTYSYHFKR